ncbi:MAG: 3-deoxy-8-phosphooctulonate synthase [Candidatus Omnitrophota bacterium]
MKFQVVNIHGIKIGAREPFVLIAGPCVIEDRNVVLKIASAVKKAGRSAGVPVIFKASYDKANRTSHDSFRGLGMEKGLDILREVKETLGVPILSDVHSAQEVEEAAGVLDILQIPAFLSRQTDLLIAAGYTGKTVNVKKGQFLAPWDVNPIIKKIESTGNKNILLTERGVSFGYNTLVSDFRSLAIMGKTGYPVVFDASHSVQQPGGLGAASGGQSEFIPLLARCGVAAGCHAVFLEVHTHPRKALSDGPNMLALDKLEKLLTELKAIDRIVKKIKA